MTSTMRAVVLDEFGPPTVLRERRIERPEPGPGQVLVRVTACGVCGHDILARRGLLSQRTPLVLGHEIVGVVEQITDGVRDLAPGQRVALVQRIPCGTCRHCADGATNLCRGGPGFYGEDLPGGYAEYVIATEMNAVGLPDTISDVVGATLTCGVGTGLRALRQAALGPGDVVVITGAGGGVGYNTVKLAAAMGCRPLAVSGSPGKREALLAAGAERVIDPHDRAALRAAARELSDGVGAAAAIEIVGPPTFDNSLAALRADGRLVLVGNTDPAPVQVNPGAVIVRELKILGSAHATRADLADVVDLVATGRIGIDVGAVEPLTRAASLHAAVERRDVTGRAVLRII